MLRVLTAGVLFVFAAGAQAQTEDPKLWYVAIGAGGAWYDDLKLNGAIVGEVGMDTGFTVNGAIGRYLDDERVIRLEAEAIYDRADISDISGPKAGGNLANVGLMFNFLYDIQTNSSWVPYLGGGIGYSRVSVEDLSTGGPTLVDDSANAFSWQFKAGIAYQFNPSMAVTLGYRYYATDNVSFDSKFGGSVNTGGTDIQNAELGFRFHF